MTRKEKSDDSQTFPDQETLLKGSLPVLVALALAAGGLGPGSAAAQDRPAGRANYDLAQKLAQENVKKMVFDLNVIPEWIGGTDAFWYRWTTSKGTDFYDPAAGFGPVCPARADAAAQRCQWRSAAVTTPMTTLGVHTDTPNKAMLMPTANASRLVASDSVSKVRPRVGSLLIRRLFAAGLPEHLAAHVAQQHERHPTGIPTQGAANCSPASQPTIGIMNWNRPKWKPSRKTCRGVTVSMTSPAATATANASAARPTAISESHSSMSSNSPKYGRF